MLMKVALYSHPTNGPHHLYLEVLMKGKLGIVHWGPTLQPLLLWPGRWLHTSRLLHILSSVKARLNTKSLVMSCILHNSWTYLMCWHLVLLQVGLKQLWVVEHNDRQLLTTCLTVWRAHSCLFFWPFAPKVFNLRLGSSVTTCVTTGDSQDSHGTHWCLKPVTTPHNNCQHLSPT